MRQNKSARHQDVPNRRSGRNRKKTRTFSSSSSIPVQGSLLQRGNYSLLRLLTIINAHGSNGIATFLLLDELGSKADRINAIIRVAEELELIERKEGESEHGHFPPVYNIITDKGRQLLQSQLSTGQSLS